MPLAATPAAHSIRRRESRRSMLMAFSLRTRGMTVTKLAGTVPAAPWHISCSLWREATARDKEMAGGRNSRRGWPDDGVTRVPYFVYENAELYQEEQERIFRGPVWNYLGLEIEILDGEFHSPLATSLRSRSTQRFE